MTLQLNDARENSRRLANERRRQILGLKDEWRTLDRMEARERLAEMLRDPSAIVGSMPVERLVLSCPGMGPVRTDQCLLEARIATGRLRVRDLDANRRELLAHAVLAPLGPRGEFEIPNSWIDNILTEVHALRQQVGILRSECRRLRGAA